MLCGRERPERRGACRFAALFRPFGAGGLLVNLTHGIAVGYSISPLTGLQANAGWRLFVGQAFQPADSRRSCAPSGLDHVNTHNRGLGSLSPGYSPSPRWGLQINAGCHGQPSSVGRVYGAAICRWYSILSVFICVYLWFHSLCRVPRSTVLGWPCRHDRAACSRDTALSQHCAPA